MKKCVRLSIATLIPTQFLREKLLVFARSMNIEGTAQVIGAEQITRIIACGHKERVDEFVDYIHKELAKESARLKEGVADIQVEPFVKDKDYRSVFRVIE
jgi:acylphosphatase